MNFQFFKNTIIILLFFLVFTPNQLKGQLEYEFVDSLFRLILLEQIDVYDENRKQLLFEDKPWMELIEIDTSVCCRWTRPKFENNIFQKGIDGIIVKFQNVIDTITYLPDRTYVQFNKRIDDDNGNFRFWKTVFLIKRNYLKNLEIQNPKVNYPKSLITPKNEFWANDQVLINGKSYQLDSCHHLYQLKVNEDFTFSQTFSNSKLECFTQSMKSDIEVGLNVGDAPEYLEILQGHYINIYEGIWKIKNDSLYLISGNKSKFLELKIKSISKKYLILETPSSEIVIKLKKNQN